MFYHNQMTTFIKTNKLVSDLTLKYLGKTIKEISVIFNTHNLHQSEYGRYVKPICIVVEFEGDNVKERIENPDYYFNIPSTLNYIVDAIKASHYAAILIDPTDPKTYKEDAIYYNKALAVIRNPKLIKELEEMEQKQIVILEYSF